MFRKFTIDHMKIFDQLETVIQSNDVKAVKKLLNKDKKSKLVNYRFSTNLTPLHVACESGNNDIVSLLCKQNADVSAKEDALLTPLHIACKNGFYEIILILLKYNAKVKDKCFQGNTPLHFLVRKQPKPELISKLYEILENFKISGLNLEKRNLKGETPLGLACLRNSEKIAMWLIRQGVDVNIANNQGVTPLHYAVRYGSSNLVSVLLVGGASISKVCNFGTPIEAATFMKRPEIIKLLNDYKESDNSLYSPKVITINGRELNLATLQEFKRAVASVYQGLMSTKKSRDNYKVEKYRLILSMLSINSAVLTIKNPDVNSFWKGTIISDNTNYFCKVDNDKYVGYKTFSTFSNSDIVNEFSLSLSGLFSIKVYLADRKKFAITRYDTPTSDEEIYYVESEDELSPLLHSIVLVSGRTIEYVDDKEIYSLFTKSKLLYHSKSSLNIEIRSSANLSPSSLATQRRKRTPSENMSPAKISKSTKSTRETKSSKDIKPVSQSNIDKLSTEGVIFTTNFKSFIYSDIFSPDLNLKEEGTGKENYYLASGSLSDIINFTLLHAHPELFSGYQDVNAFYLSYYRYCTPDEFIEELSNLWQAHKIVPWPQPYSSIPASSRLFAYIAGFINSKFVLNDFDKEIKFRSDLVEFYGNVVSNPEIGETKTKLSNMLLKQRKGHEQNSIIQMCDLNSLLGEDSTSISPLEFESIDVDSIVQQIINISADLYKQVRITELLNGRYQKDKSCSIHKLHDFSNKLYLLVPTTILQQEIPDKQVSMLKKWISIGEKLQQKKDYNSAVQIVNGVTETSIMRLQHLKSSLSTKWVERFERVRLMFDSDNNYKNYRLLDKSSPCIPFIAVTLRDLIYSYDGHPDKLNNGINFQKIRAIHNIIRPLGLENSEQVNFGSMQFDPKIAQGILNATPLDQDSLYERSIAISNEIEKSKKAPPSFEDYNKLELQNKDLIKEIEQLKLSLVIYKKKVEDQQKTIEKLETSLTITQRKLSLNETRSRDGSLKYHSSPTSFKPISDILL